MALDVLQWGYVEEKVETDPILYTIDTSSITSMAYVPDDVDTAQAVSANGPWFIDATPPTGLDVVTDGMVFQWADSVHATVSGVVFRGWNASTGAGSNVGSASSGGLVQMNSLPAGGSNSVSWRNLAQDRTGGLSIYYGVFRTAVAPLKAGSFQLQAGSEIANANGGGVLSGDFGGLVDFQRGIVKWYVSDADQPSAVPVAADDVTYNAVFLQYIPLDQTLLGLNTVRLPLDGKVPIYRAGGQVVVHNTLTTALPNPLTLGAAYDLGRERIAAAWVRTAAGVRVPGTKYTVDFNAGEITFPLGTDLTGLDQPFTVHHRIEDELLVMRADISGRIDLVSGLTHDYPAGTSYVSSKLRKGDLFARPVHHGERVSWQGSWDATFNNTSEPTASLNWIDHPIQVTNRGAIRERWALVFMSATTVRVFGENVGQVLFDVSITGTGFVDAANTQHPGSYYWRIPKLAFGSGWAAGNVILFETFPAGGTAWVTRTTLQGPATEVSDVATIAFRSDVDTP